jgi:hypothetical protein
MSVARTHCTRPHTCTALSDWQNDAWLAVNRCSKRVGAAFADAGGGAEGSGRWANDNRGGWLFVTEITAIVNAGSQHTH